MGDYLKNAWDLWVQRAWQVTDEDVEFVRDFSVQSKAERVKGIVAGAWNSARSWLGEKSSEPAMSEVNEKLDVGMEGVDRPITFTGEILDNTGVAIECDRRMGPSSLAEVIRATQGDHADDKSIVISKCPLVFDWKLNESWNVDKKITQKMSIENLKGPELWNGSLGEAARTGYAKTQVVGKKKRRKKTLGSTMRRSRRMSTGKKTS